jgi:GNAT superfamily N-acetyltransferase
MIAKEGRYLMKLDIRPLTADLWPSLEDLFLVRKAHVTAVGACTGAGAAYRKRPREKNRAAFRKIVKSGPPPGLLAFDGDVAVGWCQLTPRSALPWIDHEWRLKRADEVPVWALSCLYVRIGYRKCGVTTALIAAALKAAKRAKAPQLEAYPLDAAKSPSASGTGYASTFARAGFKTVACHFPPRPIMRHDLKTISRHSSRRP